MEDKQTIEIKMALGLQNGLILFQRKDQAGLWIGTKDNYKTLGKYTGELKKVCNNGDPYIFYSIFDIICEADNPDQQEVLKIIYKLLQQPEEKLKALERLI